MATIRKRYSLKRVLAVTGICCVLLLLLQIIIVAFLSEREELFEEVVSARNIISKIINFIFHSFFYYLLVNAYYTLFKQRKKVKDHTIVSILGMLAYMVFYALGILIIKKEITEKASEVTNATLIVATVLSSIFMTGIGFLIAYLTSLRDEQKQAKILETQKMELEVQNSQANFNFLKAQINPHFLHNTLNFFYAKALPLSAELSEGILCLSDIMRYALNEGGKDEKAMLKDEITHLENVIRINQLRFSNNLNVQFEIKGEVGNVMIVPFVLITLVENSFKHGDIRSQEHPILIRLEVRGKELYFYCSNKKKTGFKEISTGIGLPNILKRLDFAYGNKYSYTVKDEGEFYTTELIIREL